MQLSGDTALATAVDADVRYVIWKLEADWNKDGNYVHALSDLTEVVKTLSPDRDITSTLPIQTSVIEGFMAAQLNVRLGGVRPGDTESIGELLSPLRTDSPLYGKPKVDVPIRAWIGMRKADGTETLLQQFQGKISSCRVAASREVTITALDGAENTRAEINLPIIALASGSTVLSARRRLRINSQWVIDYVFRRNGIYTSPPPHAKVFYCATLHGSTIPEVGHSAQYWVGEGVVMEDTQIYYPGRAGWGLAYGGPGFYYVTKARGEANAFGATSSQTLCMQVQADLSKAPVMHPTAIGALAIYSTGNSWLVGTSFMLRTSTTGQLLLNCYNGNTLITTVNGPTLGTAGWTDCWVEIELGSGTMSSSTVRFPGLTVSAVNLSGLGTSPTLSTYPHISTYGAVPIQDLHISDRTGLSTGVTRYDPTTWVSQADYDAGINEFMGMPIKRGVQSWDLLKEVVGAELGMVGFSESGRPFFKNRNTLRRQNLVIEKTITGEKEVLDLGTTEQTGSVRNVVSIAIKPTLLSGPDQVAVANSIPIAAWRSVFSVDDPDELTLPGGTSFFDVVLTEAGALADPYTTPTLYTTAQWANVGEKPYTHGFAVTSIAGAEITSGVSITVLPLSPLVGLDMIRLIVVNTSGTSSFLRFQTTDGTPALKIRGRTLFSPAAKTVSFKRAGSIAKYGERVHSIEANDWIQTERFGQTLAVSLLKDLATPVPIIDQVETVGDPRLQLQDSVQLEDAGGLGGPVYTGVIGVQRSLEVSGRGGKLTDRLTVRPYGGPDKWILGHPTQSILGSTTKL